MNSEGGMRSRRWSPRYVVAELSGFLQVGGDTKRPSHAHPGVSFTVLDRPFNHRVVETFRSEDYGGQRHRAIAKARNQAARLAAELNGESPPSIVAAIGLRDECRNGHALTEANVYFRNGSRRCLTCRREGWRRSNDRRGLATRRPADLLAADLSPACPRCGNLCIPDAVVCVECGCRLYDDGQGT